MRPRFGCTLSIASSFPVPGCVFKTVRFLLYLSYCRVQLFRIHSIKCTPTPGLHARPASKASKMPRPRAHLHLHHYQLPTTTTEYATTQMIRVRPHIIAMFCSRASVLAKLFPVRPKLFRVRPQQSVSCYSVPAGGCPPTVTHRVSCSKQHRAKVRE